MGKQRHLFFLSSGSTRRGQGQLLMLALLGLALSVFSWVASSSLINRKKDEMAFARKVMIRNEELKLRALLNSPHYLNNMFLQANGLRLDLLKKLNFNGNVLIPNPDNDEKTKIPLLFGNNTLHEVSHFQACPIDTAKDDPRCAFKSQVTTRLYGGGGVGYLQFQVTLVQVEGKKIPYPWNSQLDENQITLMIPYNLFGVEFNNDKLSCHFGFKILNLAQGPGEFLCVQD